MSIENLKEYARRCAVEPELRATARDLGASNIDGHVQHAASLGLDWTEDDIFAFRKEIIDSDGDFDSLSEEDLEQIAGGAVTAAVIAGVAAVAAVGAAAAGAAGAGAGAAVATSSTAGSAGW